LTDPLDIRPKTNWLAIITGLAGVAGIAWGIAQWAATTPTRKEFNDVRDDMIRVRIELPAVNSKIERVEQSQLRIEHAVQRIESKQDVAARRRPRTRSDGE
jgi:hypothetical protein